MAKLTVKKLESLRQKDVGTTIRDEHNLLGKVRTRTNGDTPTVSVSFYFRFKRNDKFHDVSCGTWPKETLPEIRAKRDQARSSLAEGLDPIAERKAEKLRGQADQAEAIAIEQTRLNQVESQQARMITRELFEHWARVELIRLKDGGKEIRRMFEKDVLPLLGNMAVEDVKKGHIAMVVDGLLARGVQRMAKMIFSLVRQMFRFAQDRDIVENDPTAAIRKAKIGGKEIERERVLSEDEIKELHAQLPNARMLRSTEKAVWICLSTCCRIGELLGASWKDVDFEKRTWRIPAENSKNGKSHLVYLSDFAYFQFRELYSLNGSLGTGDSNQQLIGWCYPDRNGTSAVCSKTVTKQLGDRQRDAAPMSGRIRRKPSTTSLKSFATPSRRLEQQVMTQAGRQRLPTTVAPCWKPLPGRAKR